MKDRGRVLPFNLFKHITIDYKDLWAVSQKFGTEQRYNNLRYGQFFLNHICPTPVIFPELFYEEEKYKCINLIHDNFTLRYIYVKKDGTEEVVTH
jgi:hypothetical protein